MKNIFLLLYILFSIEVSAENHTVSMSFDDFTDSGLMARSPQVAIIDEHKKVVFMFNAENMPTMFPPELETAVNSFQKLEPVDKKNVYFQKIKKLLSLTENTDLIASFEKSEPVLIFIDYMRGCPPCERIHPLIKKSEKKIKIIQIKIDI